MTHRPPAHRLPPLTLYGVQLAAAPGATVAAIVAWMHDLCHPSRGSA